MSKLSNETLNAVQEYIQSQGLTFDPFRNEIMDHILSDIEDRMSLGESENQSLQHVLATIPDDQLITVEEQTKQIISNRLKLNTVMSYVSLGLFFLSSVFKLLHLPGATIFLVSGVVLTSITFVASAISGARIHKNRQGKTLLYSAVAMVVFFLASWLLKVLGQPFGTELIAISVFLFLFLFLAMTFHFQKSSTEMSILIHLHSINTIGIERFIILLMCIGGGLFFAADYFQFERVMGTVILILAIVIAGLHHFVCCWKIEETNNLTINFTISLIILSFMGFVLPALGTLLPIDLRYVISLLFFIGSGILVLQNSPIKVIKPIVVLSMVLWMLWLINVLTSYMPKGSLFVYFPMVLVISLVGLYLARKDSLAFSYLLVSAGNVIINWPQ